MKMQLLLIAGVVIGGLLILGYLFRPIPQNFLYYLLWRATAANHQVDGDVKVGDALIHYRSYGQGPPVLLLHGGLSRRLSWFSQVPMLVESNRQVVLVDSRGHGDSELGSSAITYRSLAADAIRVMDALQLQSVDVIGWSDGANTALLMARYWPGRINRIVAISGNYNPSGLIPESNDDDWEPRSQIMQWVQRLWSGAGKKFEELENRLRHLWRTGPNLSAEDLRKITPPVLVIVGEHDLVSVAHARKMAELLPHGQLAIIPKGGHATLMTNAGEVNTLIGQFLALPK